MREIRCPKCGEVFQVDESGYAAIVKQVRDKEFEKEIREREAQFRQEKQAAEELARTKTEQKLSGQISSQETRIRELETRLQAEKDARDLEIQKAAAEKERELAQRIAAKDQELAEDYNGELAYQNNDLYDLVCDAIALFYRANPNPIPYERRRDGRR